MLNMQFSKYSRLVWQIGLAGVLSLSLIGCQESEPEAPIDIQREYTIGGPGTPAAIDSALQNQPSVAAPIAGQTNLLHNPDLEISSGNNPEHWVSCATDGTQSSSDAVSGVAVLIGQNRCLYQSVQTRAGQHLNLNCSAKLLQNQGWNGWGLNFYDPNFKKLGAAPVRRIGSAVYEQYQTSAIAPANTAFATVWAYSEGQTLLDQCSLTQSEASSDADLIVNGGFEENLSNWSPCTDGTPLGISRQAQSGTRSLRLTHNGCAYQEIELKPNHEYEITCQAKVSGHRFTEMGLVYLDANWQQIIRKGVEFSASTFSSDSVRLITPANMVHSALALYNQSAEALFDACSVKDTGLEIVSTEYTKGKWSGVQAWPLLAIHTSLLPNGQVLTWDSNADDVESNTIHEHPYKPTRASLWNPITNSFTSADANTGKDLFCAGLNLLANGNLLVAGGNQVPENGAHNALTIFNPNSKTWSRGPDMAFDRWYPSVTALANGDALITGGGPSIPEVYSGAASGSIRSLSTASLAVELYPWMQLAPNGKVVHFGPEPTLHSLETNNTGGWTTLGSRDDFLRDYGSYAMFAPGKILVTGGGVSLDSRISSQILNINDGLVVSGAANMNFRRRQHNLTILPDGKVIATGGVGSGAKQIDVRSPVLAAEVWNPSANRWEVMASENIPRQYHSTALLLPDGRILSAGGGFCGNCPLTTYFHKDGQIFSPTYLFNKDGTPAKQPVITSAPATATYGSSFAVKTDTDIARVTLVALSSVTHSVNMNQRFMELSFTKSGNDSTVTTPANPNLAPPGTYMLFVLNAQGVPSVARMLKLQ
jgi:Domain of unknown function (DUF1929)/Carbohydrate binding domain